MKSELKRCDLTVKKSLIEGYGVFANEAIAQDETIEECHVVVSKEKRYELNAYYFWGDEVNILAFGFGSIYNHSDTPNARYAYDAERQLLIFTAARNIKKGEEILIYYGKDWFASRDHLPIINASWVGTIKRMLPTILRFCIVLALLALVILPFEFFTK